ncbi:MAG: ABC transporter ATP-binding protein [Desulfobulbales bacterium]|nr:ABC transporter ATP-binding protein [Desulfobulbales bacterium]
MLNTENLTKTYKGREGAIHALDNLNLRVEDGEIFGLLGPNGAGKTTTVKMIMGFMAPTHGEIVFRDKKLAMAEPRPQFGYLPESFKPNPNLTVGEYLSFHNELAGSAVDPEQLDKQLRLVGMDRFKQRRVSDLSKGMGQRLGLAQAFAGDPDFLILDEPTSGLDPIGRSEVIDLLLSVNSQGKTIFFCSHILSEVERLCDRIGILVEGRLQFVGRVEEFLKKWQAENLDEGFRREVKCVTS